VLDREWSASWSRGEGEVEVPIGSEGTMEEASEAVGVGIMP
jgi:hypothetical protein